MDAHGRRSGLLRRNKQESEAYDKQVLELVEEGIHDRYLTENEAEMIRRILGMDDIQAQDIMTPRNQVLALSEDLTLTEAVDEMIRVNKTRFPVFREDLDDIIGFLHLRSAFVAYRAAEQHEKRITDIPGLLYEAFYIPETKGISSLFKEMQSKKVHIAIVIDEYGQTSGILTLEDIIEEIFGNILDEREVEEKLIEKKRDGSFMISGLARLEDVGPVLGIDFGDVDFDTLNGYLIDRLGYIPEEKDLPCVKDLGYSFQIVSVDANCIESVHAKKLSDVPYSAAKQGSTAEN